VLALKWKQYHTQQNQRVSLNIRTSINHVSCRVSSEVQLLEALRAGLDAQCLWW
jgi:hypothetical protein